MFKYQLAQSSELMAAKAARRSKRNWIQRKLRVPLVCSNATLYGNVSDVSGARLGQRSTQGRNQRKEVRDSCGTRLEHDKSEPTLRDILLVLDPPIHGHEDMEPSFASGAEQDAILHARPAE